MTWTHIVLLLEGATITIMVAFISAVLGLIFGTGLLVARTSNRAALVWPARLYISFIRGTPALVQILLIFYGLPKLVGIEIAPVIAGVVAVAVNSSAFVAEILRGSLRRIGPGQYEAGRALGLSPVLVWFKIILPQILLRAIPMLASEFTMVVKATSLLSVVTIVELTRRGQQIMFETFRAVDVLLVVAVIYFCICFLFTSLSRVLEKRVAAILREGRVT